MTLRRGCRSLVGGLLLTASGLTAAQWVLLAHVERIPGTCCELGVMCQPSGG